MIDHALKTLDSLARHQIEQHVPGIGTAITDQHQLLDERAYGFANLESQTPLTTRHRFEFGSIGKSFTAIVLLQLAGEGKIDLHAPVTDYLPWFEVQSRFDPITTHHLLTHSAGITGGSDFPGDKHYEIWSLRETETFAAPGERFHYSNLSYKALGVVIEQITGQSYAQNVQQRILDPLGMDETIPYIIHDDRHTYATGYHLRYDDRPWHASYGLVPATWLETDTADGCIVSTPSDLAIYLRMLLNRGDSPSGRILTEAQFQLMTTPYIEMDRDKGWDYGYGIMLMEVDGAKFFGHGGGMVGYTTSMVGLLDGTAGIVTMSNFFADHISIAIPVLQAMSAGEPSEELPTPDPAKIPDAERYAGRFTCDGQSIEIVADGETLTLHHDGVATPLATTFYPGVIAPVEGFDRHLFRLVENDDENVIGLSHGPRFFLKEGAKAPATGTPPEEWSAYEGLYRSYNPWFPCFRVYIRGDQLYLSHPVGGEDLLIPREDGGFDIGESPAPDTITFDTPIDGHTRRAILSAAPYYRFFTE